MRASITEARHEFEALTSASGMYSLDRVQIALGGEDRVRWLNGMVTNNVRDLAAGHGVYAFLLSPQGRIQADLYAFNLGEKLIVETESAQAGKMLEIFDHYIIMDDVEVENRARRIAVLGVAGPNAAKLLAAAGFAGEDLPPLELRNATWHGHQITIVHGDNPLLPAYELWVDAEAKTELQQALAQAGAIEIHDEALEMLRIASGIPKYGTDIRDRDLPQETAQDRALNFSKGCYIGQEIVERIRSRGAVHRMLTGFEVEGTIPAPGFRVQHEGKDVAELTSVAVIPTRAGDRSVALGYGRKELMAAGRVYAAGETTVRIASLPFMHLI